MSYAAIFIGLGSRKKGSPFLAGARRKDRMKIGETQSHSKHTPRDKRVQVTPCPRTALRYTTSSHASCQMLRTSNLFSTVADSRKSFRQACDRCRPEPPL